MHCRTPNGCRVWTPVLKNDSFYTLSVLWGVLWGYETLGLSLLWVMVVQTRLLKEEKVQLYKRELDKQRLPGKRLFHKCIASEDQVSDRHTCLDECTDISEYGIDSHADDKPECMLAYNNIHQVADFIELKCPNILNIFENYIATITITRGKTGWIPKKQQAIFYQFIQDGKLRFTAAILDVVAHEFCHGIINNKVKATIEDPTTRIQTPIFQYENQSGALQESLCDIFAILVSNRDKTDIKTWKWTIGEGLGNGGGAVRDLANPTRCSHPNHIDDCKRLEPGEKPNKGNDWGYIHTNCGIHNQAFHNLATSKNGNGDYIFNRDSLIDFFLRSLTKLLEEGKPDSGFVHGLRAMLEVAEELPEHDLHKNIKINRIREAFERVGIVDDRTVDRYSETVLIE